MNKLKKQHVFKTSNQHNNLESETNIEKQNNATLNLKGFLQIQHNINVYFDEKFKEQQNTNDTMLEEILNTQNYIVKVLNEKV